MQAEAFFFFFFPSPSAVTALEEVFITVFTAVRKDLYKYRKLIKVCFFFFLLVSHVASGPRESLIKYSKFKTKTLHSVYTAIRVREINDIQAVEKMAARALMISGIVLNARVGRLLRVNA